MTWQEACKRSNKGKAYRGVAARLPNGRMTTRWVIDAKGRGEIIRPDLGPAPQLTTWKADKFDDWKPVDPKTETVWCIVCEDRPVDLSTDVVCGFCQTQRRN